MNRFDSTDETRHRLRALGYPESVRNEVERESYDKYIAATTERERWEGLSWQQKVREEWEKNKSDIWKIVLAVCVIYAVAFSY